MAGRARHNDFMKTYRLYNTSGDRKLVEEEGEAEYAKLKADPAAVERHVDQLKLKIKGREGTLTKFVKVCYCFFNENQLSKKFIPNCKKYIIYKAFTKIRHLHTVPVRLLKPQNDLMKDHQDGHFANAFIVYMKDYGKLMGPGMVNFLSQDDKARVPLGFFYRLILKIIIPSVFFLINIVFVN